MPDIITSTVQNQDFLPNLNRKIMRELLQTLVATTDIKMQGGSISISWLSSVNVLVLV